MKGMPGAESIWRMHSGPMAAGLAGVHSSRKRRMRKECRVHLPPSRVLSSTGSKEAAACSKFARARASEGRHPARDTRSGPSRAS